MARKQVLKDICPKCQELKPMGEASYGIYKTLCNECEQNLKDYKENPIYAFLMAFLTIIILVLLLKVSFQSDQISLLRSDVEELKRITALLK